MADENILQRLGKLFQSSIVLKKTPTSQNISFPKDNWYIVPSTRVTDKPLRYFTRLLEYFQECNSLVEYNYLDRSWFEIFKHR